MTERQLLGSFSRMLPELRTLLTARQPFWHLTPPTRVFSVRYSSASHLLSIIPKELQAHHRVQTQPSTAPAPRPRAMGRARQHLASTDADIVPARATGLWDGWEDACGASGEAFDETQHGEAVDSALLDALGF